MTALAQPTLDFDDERRVTRSDKRRPAAHLCVACGVRPARFQYRGIVKADRFHTLCFQCYRSTVDAVRNLELPGRALVWPGASRVPSAVDEALRRARTDVHRLASLPIDRRRQPTDKYEELAQRRRHAQIAARHALDGGR